MDICYWIKSQSKSQTITKLVETLIEVVWMRVRFPPSPLIKIYKYMNQNVIYLNHHGSDEYIAETARFSTGSTNLDVEKTINFLIKNGHTSPLEFAQITFEIQCPIFVARQFMRHRMASYIEKSMRYYKGDGSDIKFYHFDDYYEEKGINNIYNDIYIDGEIFPGESPCGEVDATTRLPNLIYLNHAMYKTLLKNNITSEKARAVLPQAMMTTFRTQFNIRSLMNFFKLRLDKHAQDEIRTVAEMMYERFKELFPLTAKAFENYVLHSITFSREELNVLNRCVADNDDNDMDIHKIVETEKKDFIQKLYYIIKK